jgi:alpha-beta hydrolase superfamily lysophospholipase
MKTKQLLSISVLSALSATMIATLNHSARADGPVLSVWQKSHGYSELVESKSCPEQWHCSNFDFYTEVVSLNISGTILPFEPVVEPHEAYAEIRAGYLQEDSAVPFKGNILYFEGLGDSMLNHQPLFEKLTHAGFRVIAFDYMGQGGSTGNMDDTRIEDIPRIGEIAWQKFARDVASYPKRTILGWSTGGLAAYFAASSGQADQVILIAPGIAANAKVGSQIPKKLEFDEITLSTLTHQTYSAKEFNPHVDAIRPPSPLVVPDFAVDLQLRAVAARNTWSIGSSVRGFVLLSGDVDTYVNAAKTRAALSRQAPQFEIRQYAGAFHEIDNEIPSISDQADSDILAFLQ